MKKFLKTALILMLAFTTVFAVACGGTGSGETDNGGGQEQTDPNENKPTPGGDDTVKPEQPIETKYDEPISSPDYPKVDEIDYTFYYFDGENGDDSNDGLSQQTAKKSINQLNSLIVKAKKPAKFLLKGGTKFGGTLSVATSAPNWTEEKPLLIDTYGEGKALIDGQGALAAVEISNSNVRVSNLEITNPAGYIGVYGFARFAGAMENIVIQNCHIHDINWNWTNPKTPQQIAADEELGSLDVRGVCPNDRYVYEHGGIIFSTHAEQKKGPSWYQNVWVEGNRVERTSRSGMFFTSMWVKSPGIGWGVNKYINEEKGWYPSSHMYIRNNHLEYQGGDNIVLIGTNDSFIEHNVGYHANFLGRSGYFNAGIWPMTVKNVVIQYNEAAYCHLDNGAGDGEGFDLDIGCKDVLFQYNYSHDNDGGGLLVCNAACELYVLDENGNHVFDEERRPIKKLFDGDWDNVHIRNNLFVNNGRTADNPAWMVVSSSCKNMKAYNNTVIMREDLLTQSLIQTGNFASTRELPSGFEFNNNVIYCPVQSHGTVNLTSAVDWTFENNLYYNISETVLEAFNDAKAVKTVDPQITIPADTDGYEAVLKFIPNNDAVFTGGLPLERALAVDLAGKDAKNKNAFGAFCSK